VVRCRALSYRFSGPKGHCDVTVDVANVDDLPLLASVRKHASHCGKLRSQDKVARLAREAEHNRLGYYVGHLSLAARRDSSVERSVIA
jgi:hypothetical protein